MIVILTAMIGLASAAGSVYVLLAGLAVVRFARRTRSESSIKPPVTILKPLHGDEPGLAANLRSFCEQRYPEHQVVFGVRDAADPAVVVVRGLIADYPGKDLTLVIEPRVAGTNFKISNLENMMAVAKHGILVIADSDMLVAPDYLAVVTAPLADPANGLVTCLYRGRPIGGLWALLGGMFINYGFLPSALVGEWTRPGLACFGATMALHRSSLEAIGGFVGLRDQLADDYALGDAVRRLGKRIVLSPLLVDTVVSETSLAALVRHELRWSRTIRLLAPAGYAASIVTHPIALALCGLAVSVFASPLCALLMLGVFALALICRLAMVRKIGRALTLPAVPLSLVPARDVLSFAIFIASFLGNSVRWRDRSFRVGADGRLVSQGESRV
jgi:ceramide glucosyltransferase